MQGPSDDLETVLERLQKLSRVKKASVEIKYLTAFMSQPAFEL